MKQPIQGWHQDAAGDWVAELACGHGQHVRHAPPLSDRPWVLQLEGRARFLGYKLNCVRCDEESELIGADGVHELTTERLVIRPFIARDLDEIHRILNAAFEAGEPENLVAALEERRSWLQWNALSARWFDAMHQPPYGDRAVTLRATGELIGAVGYVPLLMPFDRIPQLRRTPGPTEPHRVTPEFGLFWAIDPAQQRRGYATEAGRALIDHAFDHLGLWRIIATTEYDNLASQAVMRKLGMTLTRNPHEEPAWMQVVGVCYADGRDGDLSGQEGLLT